MNNNIGSSDGKLVRHIKTKKETHKESPKKSPIHYYKQNVYGVEKIMVHDPKIAEHISGLTGQKTLSESHIKHLQELGHEVIHKPKN